METTDFEDVLREACDEAGQDGDAISQEEFKAWVRAANKRLSVAWRHHYWPDLGKVEQRFYRLLWAVGQTYNGAVSGADNSANEVWWPLTGLYYVALTSTAGGWITGCDNANFNALWLPHGLDVNGVPMFGLFVHPTTYTLSVQNGAWTIMDASQDVLYTSTAALDLTGPNSTSWVNAAQTAVVGMTSSNGVPPTDGSGNINLRGWAITQQYAIQTFPTGTQYDFINNPPYNAPVLNVPSYDPTVTYTQGDQVQYLQNVYQLFTASVLNDLPTDTANWGLIPSFDAYVPYEQAGQLPFTVVEGVFSANPRLTTRGNDLNYFLSERGVQVVTPIQFAWIQYRLRAPKLNGNAFNSGAVYLAGQSMYYSSATCPGNFYTAAVTTNAGDTPESAPTKWTIIAIPRMFHRYLVLGMAADWWKDLSGSNEYAESASMTAQGLAAAELDDVKSLYVGQMGQRVKTEVRTR